MNDTLKKISNFENDNGWYIFLKYFSVPQHMSVVLFISVLSCISSGRCGGYSLSISITCLLLDVVAYNVFMTW